LGSHPTVCDQLHLGGDIQDWWSDRECCSVLTGAVKSLVRRAFTRRWYPVDDGDTVFVIGWIEMALVSNEDITVVQREREGFVLGSFQDTVRWTESLKCGLSHWDETLIRSVRTLWGTKNSLAVVYCSYSLIDVDHTPHGR